jgi:hypothetical protein
MLVIGLGIAIIVVLALMIGMAIKQAVFDKPAPTTTATFKPGEVPELNLELPAGTTVAEARLDGANLVVRITGPEADEVLIIDPAKSRVLSRVRFNKKAP